MSINKITLMSNHKTIPTLPEQVMMIPIQQHVYGATFYLQEPGWNGGPTVTVHLDLYPVEEKKKVAKGPR